MSAKVSAESSEVIHRSIEDVWAFVSDPRNEPRWHTDILQIKVPGSTETPTSWRLGTTWIATVRIMGRRDYEVEITGLDPHHRVEFTTRTGPMRPVVSYAFGVGQSGTIFTRRVEVPFEGPMRMLAPLMRRQIAKRNARFVQNLKELLER